MPILLTLCNRKANPAEPNYYIGRPSPLQNPFPMKAQTIEERNRVCDAFEEYFPNSLPHTAEVIAEMLSVAVEYKRLQLVCYCAPLRCHGNTIINYLQNKLLEDGFDVIVE